MYATLYSVHPSLSAQASFNKYSQSVSKQATGTHKEGDSDAAISDAVYKSNQSQSPPRQVFHSCLRSVAQLASYGTAAVSLQAVPQSFQKLYSFYQSAGKPQYQNGTSVGSPGLQAPLFSPEDGRFRPCQLATDGARMNAAPPPEEQPVT
jgi:hypothetical protein